MKIMYFRKNEETSENEPVIIKHIDEIRHEIVDNELYLTVYHEHGNKKTYVNFYSVISIQKR